ncbi:Phosphatidylinositol-4-phosphate 5-kinase [Linnemannia zychae]|nr:Phosphatidylinositol-4-phosphate 5-kinase [Linnemannia zychae]
MTPQEDPTAKGLPNDIVPDLVPQGNGVYALPIAYPHTLNTTVQKVSEGTQTTPRISSPKAHSLPSHPHSRQHPSSPPPSPPQPPTLAPPNNNNHDKGDTDPVPLSPVPQVQPNGASGIYSDPGPFQLGPPLTQQQQQQVQQQQRQPSTIAPRSPPAPDQQPHQQQEQGSTGVPPVDSLAEHQPPVSTPTPPLLPLVPVSVTIPLSVDVNVNVNIINSNYSSENGTTVASPPHPAPSIADSPSAASYTYTYSPPATESSPFPHRFPVIVSSEHTVPSLPTSPSTPLGSQKTNPLSVASIEQEQLFVAQQQQLHQLQQEHQYEHHEHQEQPIEYHQQQQQPPAVELAQSDILLQQQHEAQLQVQSGQVQMQEGQPQQQQQQPQSIPTTPQNADRDIGPLVPPKSPGGPFGPPARASTMEIRRIRPGSQLLNEPPARSQQQDSPQGESSSRARHRQIYRRNTYSADLGSTSFRRSDDEMEMDELEEARRRMEALKKSSSRRMSKRKKDEDNDRVLIGTRIGEDHVNYVLMYNMLTGIRVSVSRCNAKPQRMLVDEDFTAAHKLAFDITGNELTPSSKYDFKFKDYAPWVFRHLREDFHIDASDYLVSLTSKYILSELGSPGKSGSFFYFSQDYRFIIKTIHHAEHKFMRKILKDYFNHVKRNPHTLLCRFFGLHRVKLPHGRKIHFVVMGNVFPPNRDIHETYDLKGSTLGRAISDEELANNPRATQKDLNWVNRNRKLELGPEKRHLFVEQIKRDVELLSRLNIMDYSLLIGIHDIERGNKDNIRDNTLKVFHPDTSKPLKRETARKDKRESKVNALRMAVKVSDPQALGPSTLPSDSFSERRHFIFYADDGGLLSTNEQNEQGEDLYYLGIIDILTPYNYVKKIEHYWKSLSQDKHAISAVNPREYASRFLSFMIHAIKVNHDVMAALQSNSQHNSHPHSE